MRLADKRVLVTGGHGFLGRHLCQVLEEEFGATVYVVCHSDDPGRGGDLTQPEHVGGVLYNCLRAGPLDYVFHLAGFNGGIEFNRKYPAEVFYENTVMGLNLLNGCAGKRVGKVVSAVASCGYPWHGGRLRSTSDGILMEDDFLGRHNPHPSVACHGLAKRNLQWASSFYRRQFGLAAVCVCPTTLYGPGDSFDPERTKLMGGMVKRFVDARRRDLPSVEVWGTGRPLREFLHVGDCARLMVRAALAYDDSDRPLNLGTGQEVSVAELARLVAEAAGYQGEVRFDHSRPDGQYRKRLDLSRMLEVLGEFEAKPLAEGVRETVAWYEKENPWAK